MTFWETLKSWLVWVRDRMLLPTVTILVAVGALVLVAFGLKGVHVGGLLGKLLDKGDPPQPPPNPNRDVRPGTPDESGHTEVVPQPLDVEDGEVVHPETGGPIPLPKGVEPDQVAEVVVVQPVVSDVVVTDTSKVKVSDLDKLLDRINRK